MGGPAALRDTAERRRPPVPEGRPPTPLSSEQFSRWRLQKRGADVNRGGRIARESQRHPPPAEANRAPRDSMASQIQTCSWGVNVIVIVRNYCVSLGVVEVVVAGPAVESADMSPLVQSSVDDACEDQTLPVQRDSGELREPWLPFGVEKRFGFRVSICDAGISPSSAARCDWRRCLRRTEAFQ